LINFSFVYEELIRQAKEFRKTIYKTDEITHDKKSKKREASGLLENQIEYSKDKDAKVGYKTVDTSFFGCKTNIVMTSKKNNNCRNYYYRRKIWWITIN